MLVKSNKCIDIEQIKDVNPGEQYLELFF
jgi:hypothetical protein